MSENETKKKPTTKKTTSTRKKKVEEKTKTETVDLNEVKEELNINDDINPKKEYTASSHIEMIPLATIDTVDQKINTVKDSVNNNMKSIISIINANGNNSIITTKAEMAKTNSLIKEKSELINNNLVKIEELLKNNDAQKLNPDEIKTALDHFRDNIESLYSSVHEFIDEDEKIFESIDEKYNALYKNISLITDAIVNDDEKSVEDLLVAQNQYIKDLMEKHNDRINLNSERMNMIISQMSSLVESNDHNYERVNTYLTQLSNVIKDESNITHDYVNNIRNLIDDSKNCYDHQLDALKEEIKENDKRVNRLVMTNTIISVLTIILILLGFMI